MEYVIHHSAKAQYSAFGFFTSQLQSGYLVTSTSRHLTKDSGNIK